MSNTSNQVQIEFEKRRAEYIEQKGSINEREEAILFAQSVMLQRLIAPLTAVFPSIENFNVVEKDGGYKVTGYVDSQNDHGALVRTDFTITGYKRHGEWLCIGSSQGSESFGFACIKAVVLLIMGAIGVYFIINGVVNLLL